MPAALPSRAAADGPARPVGRGAGSRGTCRRGATPRRSTGPAVFYFQACSSCSMVYSLLSLSLSLVLTSPYRRSFSSPGFLACGMPGGSRAMPSPKLGTLHARSPGPQVIFRPHPTNPLMQSSDAVAGCAAVWPLMGRSSSSFPPVRLYNCKP